MNIISASAFASNFCAPQAIAAAQGLASINGSISQDADATSADGKSYTVILSEEGLGQDTYAVKTNGGHDCIVQALKVIGQPTLRP
ncbi:hypothetical protein [Bdellovibrio sp. HCB274]|uniref:hypothetical protein n=1 Tax=Bdellovibrio sp. HCB274 TaxID=3394361 RepID=UPI0039B66DDB